MGSLHSAVDELVTEDLSGVDTDSLQGDVIEIRALAEVLEAEWLRRVGALDRRQAHLDEGFVSLTSWLVDRTRMTASAARGAIQLARALQDLPRTASAYLHGALTTAHVRVLARAASAHPDTYLRDEEVLVGTAATLSVAECARALSYWRGALDHWAEADELYGRRRLHASRTYGGMVRVDGDLDPEGGEVLLCALEALSETTDGEDPRSPAQRRADALTELCRQALDRGELPVRRRQPPHLVVTVDLATLERRAGRRAETDRGGVLSPEAVRRLACDAEIWRVITRGESQPLDVGRTRVVPVGLWRAVVVRDRRCRWRGCDRPPRWCDVHHLLHWLDHGETKLDNLVLLCRRHHRMLHEGRQGLEMVGPDPP
ncbi:MAG: DUF222 domain-containing protein [Acidimicrobiia bacterium]